MKKKIIGNNSWTDIDNKYKNMLNSYITAKSNNKLLPAMYGNKKKYSAEQLKYLYEVKKYTITRLKKLLGYTSDYKTRAVLETMGVNFRISGRGYRVSLNTDIEDRYKQLPLMSDEEIEEECKTRLYK